MKFLDKLGLAIFSILTLILSILMCLIVFGWVDPSVITILITSSIDTQNGMYITIGISIVLILLAIKCLFFPSYERRKAGDDDEGILLQNENGKLLITKGTIKNLVVGATNEFKDINGSEVDVEIDAHDDVNVNLIINVHKETIIKDISSKLQNRVKEAVKKATDLDIKQINIKINDVQKENIFDEEYHTARKIEKENDKVKERGEKVSKSEKRTEEKVKNNNSSAE